MSELHMIGKLGVLFADLSPHPLDAPVVDRLRSALGGGDQSTVEVDADGRITRLYLLYGMIQAEHLAGLSALTKLRALRIMRCPTIRSDEWLEDLSRCPELRGLVMSTYGVTDRSLPLLERFEQLWFLDLMHTRVTSEGAARLRPKLPNCDIIR